MQFHFPSRDKAKIITAVLPFTLWSDIEEISHERQVSFNQALVILLEPTIEEYHKQYPVKEQPKELPENPLELNSFSAVPEPPTPQQRVIIVRENPAPAPQPDRQQGTVTPMTPEEKKREYSRQYYLKNKEKILAQQREYDAKQRQQKQQQEQLAPVKKPVLIVEEVPTTAPEKPEGNIENMATKLAAAREKNNKQISESIITCNNKTCPRPYWKFVKNCGAIYVVPGGDKYFFCSEECKKEWLKAHGVKGTEYTAGVYGEQ